MSQKPTDTTEGTSNRTEQNSDRSVAGNDAVGPADEKNNGQGRRRRRKPNRSSKAGDSKVAAEKRSEKDNGSGRNRRRSKGGKQQDANRPGLKSFAAKDVVQVELSAEQLSASSENFGALGLGPQAKAAAAASGFVEPTKIQTATIPAALEGRDVIGLARTGGGKTAAFLLPLVDQNRESKPSILVMAPTRELVVQIGEQARRFALACEWSVLEIFGGMNQDVQTAALESGVDVVIATPGRLLDLFGQGILNLANVQYLVLDEADRMLDMGFSEDVRAIFEACKSRKQTLMFSATFPPAVERLANFYLSDPMRVDVSSKKVLAETVERNHIELRLSERFPKLVELVQVELEAKSQTLVFANTKSSVDWVCDRLQEMEIGAERLHSGLSQSKRLRILEKFRSGEILVLVATDVAARGLDIPTVGHVINYEMPDSVDDYVHRIGRTGRHDATGVATSLVTPDKRYMLEMIRKVEQGGRAVQPVIPRSRSFRPGRSR